MIDTALAYIRDDLNRFLKPRIKSNEPLAIVSTLIDQSGKIAIDQDEALVLSPFSISLEKVKGKGYSTKRSPNNGVFSLEKGDLLLNIYLFISAYFPPKKTMKGLRALSAAILFFDKKAVFNHQNSPRLDKAIRHLSLDFYNLDFMQESNIWSSAGAKHMPSAMFKVRLQYLPAEFPEKFIPEVKSGNSRTEREGGQR